MLSRPRRGSARPRGILVLLLVLVSFVFAARPAAADVVYLYDPLGRLVRVIDATGQAATFLYDPVGNILQIARQSGISQDQTAIASVNPPTGAQGTQVTLTFTGMNLAGASLLNLPAGFSFVSSSFAASGSQDVLTVTLALDPELALGQYSLTLVSSLGGATPLPFTLTVTLPAPRVDRVIPPIATAGSLIQVEGAAFDETDPAQNQVTVNGVPLQVLSATRDTLIALVPLGVTTGPVQVTTAQGSGVSPAPLTVVPGTHPQQNQVTATLRSPFRAPDRIAVSPDGGRAYILKRGRDAFGRNRGDNTITAVDTTQHAVLALLPVGVNPSSLALTPDGSRLLVPSGSMPFSLTVINTLTLEFVATIPMPSTAADVVASPDGRWAYVAIGGASPGVAVVDLGTFAVVAQIPSAQAQYLALAPDGQTLYAIGGTVSVIDTVARQVVRTIATSLSVVSSFAVNPAAHRLYVVGQGTLAIVLMLVDLEAGTVLRTRTGPGDALALSPDGTRLYAHSVLATLSVLDPVTLATLGTVALGPPRETGILQPFPLQRVLVSADGSRLWATNSDDQSLSVVDLSTLSVLATLPVGLTPKSLGLVGGGAQLYVLNNGGNTVSVLDTATNRLVPTALERFGLNQPLGLVLPAGASTAYVVNGFAPTTVAFDPATGAGLGTLPFGDSRVAVNVAASLSRSEVSVGAASPPGVAVLDLPTRALTRFLPLPSPPRALALSLDERRLYVTTDLGTSGGTVLTTFDAATGARLGQLTLDSRLVTDSILLNPEGTRLYVLHPTQQTSTTGLVRVIDTATQTVLTSLPVGVQSIRLAWNPRLGRLYVVNSSSVSVIDPGGNQVVATIPVSGFACCNNLVFSLDGSKAYLAAFGVVVLNTATNAATTTVGTGFMRAVAVSPDGQRLFATQEFGQVTVINTATDQVITTLTVGASATQAGGGLRPVNVTFSPDGARAWVVNFLDDSLSVIE